MWAETTKEKSSVDDESTPDGAEESALPHDNTHDVAPDPHASRSSQAVLAGPLARSEMLPMSWRTPT